MDNKKTGALIAARRQEFDLTQKELADRLNVSDRTISKWERGAGFPDVSLLEPLADELGLSVLELIHGQRLTPEEQPSPEAEQSARSAAYELGHRFRHTAKRLRNALAVLGALFLVLLGLVFLRNSANAPTLQTTSVEKALALCPFVLITQEEYEMAEQLKTAALELGDSAAEHLAIPVNMLSINSDPAKLISLSLTGGGIFITYADRDLGNCPNRQCILAIPLDNSPIWKTSAEYDENGHLLYWFMNEDNGPVLRTN